MNIANLCWSLVVVAASLLVVVPVAGHVGPVAATNSKVEAHPVSVIDADIYVTKFKTTMRLTCFAEDLELLQGVEVLEDGFYDTEELREATVDHADFLAKNIKLIGAAGNQYKPKIVEIIDFEIPEGRIRSGELMRYTIGVVLEYHYDKAPEFLTITQRIIAEDLLLPSELKILLKQEGSDEPFFQMMKPDQPETFRFDWDRPLPASEASEKEWESWFDDQREKTLGIASYSSVYSFIYITNFEVRHEVLIPLASLNTFFELDPAEPGFLSIEEQDQAKPKIEALFANANPVMIDNVPVAPVFDRIDFYALDLRDFAMQAERRKVSMANGRVGVIMSYSTKGFPRDVKVTWDKFNDVVKTVDSVVIAFDEVSKTEFSMFQDDNTYHWTSNDRKPPEPIVAVAADRVLYGLPKLRIPVLSCLLALLAIPMVAFALIAKTQWLLPVAGGLLIGSVFSAPAFKIEVDHPTKVVTEVDAEKAVDIFQQLHRNMFRAFDYHSESDIYDALALSVDGELLQDLYLKINDSLRVAEQGGAISKVTQVDFIEGKKLPMELLQRPENPAFKIRSKWELLGTVEHWGHIHERNNKYEAEFVVQMIDGDWKITDMDVVDFSHGILKSEVRKLDQLEGKKEHD